MGSLRLCVLVCFLMFPLVAFAAEYDTIDELVGAYNDEKCGQCHKDIYEEWKASPHADSVNLAMGGLRNFQVFGVRQWWNREVTKAEIMKCFDCHAPAMGYATERLAREVAEMAVNANDTKDEGERESIKKELARLNVGCVGCHNLKATTVAIGRLGEPEKDAVYGVHGKEPTAHKVIKSDELRAAIFCMQCHGKWTAPDGEVIGCNTLSGSYQDGYISSGGSRTCQDCHMKAGNRGHRMMGGRDLALVREGIGLNVEVSQYRHLPGAGERRWTPSAIVNVEMDNRAGHRIPDG